jgi:hypothetical protein
MVARYRLETRIGAGGTAVVFRARDEAFRERFCCRLQTERGIRA